MSVQQAMECVMQMLLAQIQLALITVHVIQDLVAMELFVIVCKVVFHIENHLYSNDKSCIKSEGKISNVF